MEKRLVTSSVELITPEKAKFYLSRNTNNRPLRKSTIDAYARDLRDGNWRLNNQTIGFTKTGRLIDGQHRLHACIQSNISFESFVVKGLEEESNGIYVQETIDRGAARSIGDTLSMTRGVERSGDVVAAANMIVNIFTNKCIKCTTAIAYKIYKMYEDEMDYICGHAKYVRGLKTAPVLGAFIIAAKTDMEKTIAFSEQYWVGDNLKNGSPILCLRNFIYNNPTYLRSGSSRRDLSKLCLSAIKKFFDGEEMSIIRNSDTSFNFFKKHNIKEMKMISDIFKI